MSNLNITNSNAQGRYATPSQVDAKIAAQATADAQLYYSYLPQFHGIRLTSFGHSFGQVQPQPNTWAGSVYPARLRDLLNADTSLYANRTASGATMANILSTVNANWSDGYGGLVTIMGNQNDVGLHTAEATFKSNFRAVLTALQGSTGDPPTVLVIKDTTCTPTGYARYAVPATDADVATYNGYLDSVIAEFPAGWIIVADPMTDGWDPNTMTAADGQHPNDRGEAFIVASCMKVLKNVTYRPGLNVGITADATIPPTISDNFNRADSTTSLGSTTTGQAWSTYNGSVWGISSNRAYKVTAGGAGEDSTLR